MTILVFDADNVPVGGGKIKISFLCKGISWAPSYRIDLRNSKELAIQLKAVIKKDF